MKAKEALRPAARARRAQCAKSVPDFASRIAAFAGQMTLGQEAIVAGYWPLPEEADPGLLMRALASRGARLALPCIVESFRNLNFRLWSPGDPFSVNRYGIREPQAGCEDVRPDMALVPLLAFDAQGHRLGYGAGYYDRALPRVATAIGVGYAGQEVERLPAGEHDRRLDFVVTELGLRRFGSD